jgi:beta-lactam-binding protein with PASTA domain
MPKQSNLFQFIRSKTFWYNVLAALAFFVLLVFLVSFLIRLYTKHGQSTELPDLKGKSLAEVKAELDSKKLRYKVIDSVYDSKKEPHLVIEQSPRPGSSVKAYRTIYLTVNSQTPPLIKMPDLKDASLKQATMILESYQMKLGNIQYKPDLAEDVVLEQLHKGKPIAPGTEIEKGSRIDLILGDGVGVAEVNIPYLIGRTFAEALFVLEGSSLSLGALIVHESVSDTLSAVVYNQSPVPDSLRSQMNIGEGIDLFLISPDKYDAGE